MLMLCWRGLTNFGFVTNMKISKANFAREYEFELPSAVEVPDELIKKYEGYPNELLLYVLCKLICEKPDELLKRLTPNDSSV